MNNHDLKKSFINKICLNIILLLISLTATANIQNQSESQIENLISKMSLYEKLEMIGGTEFGTKPLPRLGIPALSMTDGPVGVRGNPATAFPSGISMGATFDPELIHRVGETIAEEARYFDKNVLLGPTVNLSRHPFGGRNFESYGEDPFLSGELGASYVKGIQSKHVLASLKHFALNEQEHDRLFVDVRADIRPLMELHFPAFKKVVDAGVWTVMASYNKVNGYHATENAWLIKSILKEAWNFKGFVVSDWGATHSSVPAALAGLDLEMPYGDFLNQSLASAVHSGKVPEEVINDKIRRILRAMYGIGLMPQSETAKRNRAEGPQNPQHQKLALETAQESIVLLKNTDQILPLRAKKIAILGPNAEFARTGGGGSSFVRPFYQVSPLEGLKARAGDKIDFIYEPGNVFFGDLQPIPSSAFRPSGKSTEQGLFAEYFLTKDLSGTPAFTRIDSLVDFDFYKNPVDQQQNKFSVRWTGVFIPPTTGTYLIKLKSDDRARFYINEKEMLSNWTEEIDGFDMVKLDFEAGKSYPIRLDYPQRFNGTQVTLGWNLPGAHEGDLDAAVAAAKNSEVALIFAGLNSYWEGEGVDRKTMDLPDGQDELISKVADANPNTIVILNGGNPVGMNRWINKVKGVVHAWYPGQEGGNAIADVLLGNINPSGKLPVSLLKTWSDSPAYGNYPGENGVVHYKEGLFLGYRHFDQKNIDVHFPFGFGLSYSKFEISKLAIAHTGQHQYQASVKIKNTSQIPGKEVLQLYVGEENSKVIRPKRELKGFQKVFLNPGEEKTITFHLDKTAFHTFDEATMSWKIAENSTYKIWVGNSSRDLPLSARITLDE